MKTPLIYFGGKTLMIKILKNYIPAHKTYIEGFFGGGALFFEKPKSENEIINDLNKFVFNFFLVLRDNFDELQNKIENTFYGEDFHKLARQIVFDGLESSHIDKAWAFWFLSNFSWNKQYDKQFIIRNFKDTRKLKNYIKSFNIKLKNRIQDTVVLNRDVINVIESYDNADSFYYLDPPYISALRPEGEYKQYTAEDFIKMLECIEKIKGKFLISTYDEEFLYPFIEKNGWKIDKFEMFKSASQNAGIKGVTQAVTKVECLVYNYNLKRLF